MSTVETYLVAFGIISVFYIPYVHIVLRKTKKDRDYYFDQWKASVDKNNT